MRKRVFLFALLFTSLLTACLSDEDEGEKWDAAKVCPETGTNAYGMPNRGTFTDERDGNVYRYTTIGDQVWMAENLRFALPYPYSFCYGIEACYWHKRWESDEVGETSCFKDTASLAEIAERMQLSCTDNDCIAKGYCEKFGRYYSLKDRDQKTGHELLNRDIIDSVCPKGWHVPSKAEWQVLIDNVENDISRVLSDEAYLFKGLNRIGNDTCGFAALYAGYVKTKIEESFVTANFWTSTTDSPLFVNEVGFQEQMHIGLDAGTISLRCLKD
jgi:Fibrobacter succinogenes major domain (Fib_succ_major).